MLFLLLPRFVETGSILPNKIDKKNNSGIPAHWMHIIKFEEPIVKPRLRHAGAIV